MDAAIMTMHLECMMIPIAVKITPSFVFVCFGIAANRTRKVPAAAFAFKV